MSNFVRDILVVGGGTAGWLSALHIKSALGSQANVVLLESPNVATIGVGEGTQPTLRVQLNQLGIPEDDFLKRCGATFKNGIQFVDWCRGNGPPAYVHPFFSGTSKTKNSPFSPHHVWLGQYHGGQVDAPSMADMCHPETALIKHKKAPVAIQNGERTKVPISNYAFHVDTVKLGQYLKSIAVRRGVRHLEGHVTTIRKSAKGISSVVTEDHGEIRADFFIDCTGFRRLLIGELANEFVSFDRYLFNDRAITARLPYPNARPLGIDSATTSTAMSGGWIWSVPLQDRIGTGYVYSSRFLSDQEAEEEFLRHVGMEPDTLNHIRFETGFCKRQWVDNCVAIGLAGGFIEPLEATGIAIITYALYRLLELWPSSEFPSHLRDRFNLAMERSYEWVRDFIVMHYCLSQREDSDYWRAVQEPRSIPDSLQESLESYEHTWPFGDASEPLHGYRLPDASIVSVLVGFGKIAKHPNSYVYGLPQSELDRLMGQSIQRIQRTVPVCPDHGEYLMWLQDQPV